MIIIRNGLAIMVVFFTILLSVSAQVRTLAFKTSASMVNSDATYSQYSSPVKSSYSPDASVYAQYASYNKKIKISYQIPALNALEWAIVRHRASNVLDQHMTYLLNENPGLMVHIQNLAYNDFVTLSSYAPLNVKLDFRFNTRTSPYNAEEFAPMIKGPVIQTKTLMIKK